MYKKKLLALGLTLATLLTACDLLPVTSSEPSVPATSDTSVTSEEPTTSTPVTSTPVTSTPPSSVAPTFDRNKSLVRPIEDAQDGAPVFSSRLATLPSG